MSAEGDGRKNSTTPTILARSGRHQRGSWAEGIKGWGLFLTQILTQTSTDIWVTPGQPVEWNIPECLFCSRRG